MVSVIIPAYNSAAFIEKTLNSVLCQTWTDFELIVIDDGSTDNTKEVTLKFRQLDNRIKYYHKENGGVSSARNLGLEKAEGKYISFLDSDDFWSSDFLKSMYDKLSADAYKVACYCGYIEKRGDIEIAYPAKFGTDDLLRDKLISNYYRISTDCWLIKKDFINEHKIKFTEHCHIMEDLEFFVKILFFAKKEQITYVPAYLSLYNLRTYSLTAQQNLIPSFEFMVSSVGVLKRIYNWIKDQDTASAYLPYIATSLRQKYLSFLWGMLLLGDQREYKTLRNLFHTDKIYWKGLKLSGMNYKIWEFCVNYNSVGNACRLLLHSYKYRQRKAKVCRITNTPD